MKHPSEKLSKQTMRFFTPELYIQFNSTDDEIADRANDAWELAIKEYRKHLASIRAQLPSQVKQITKLSLHDAEVLGFEQDNLSLPKPSPFRSAVAILSVKQDRTIRSIVYALGDRIHEYPRRQAWPFSKSRKHWLYDEVDLAGAHQKMFIHRVLFSDGRVVKIPFLSAIVSSVTLSDAAESGLTR